MNKKNYEGTVSEIIDLKEHNLQYLLEKYKFNFYEETEDEKFKREFVQYEIMRKSTYLTESRAFDDFIETHKRIPLLNEYLDLVSDSSFEAVKVNAEHYDSKYDKEILDFLAKRFVNTWISLIRELDIIEKFQKLGYKVISKHWIDSILGVDIIVISQKDDELIYKYFHITTNKAKLTKKASYNWQWINHSKENAYQLKNIYQRDFRNDSRILYNNNETYFDDINFTEQNGYILPTEDFLDRQVSVINKKVELHADFRSEYYNSNNKEMYDNYEKVHSAENKFSILKRNILNNSEALPYLQEVVDDIEEIEAYVKTLNIK